MLLRRMKTSPHDTSRLVSVTIPAFNAAASIGRAIQSVLTQTYPLIEVLIVDDGSQDKTGEIVRKAASHDRRVRLLTQENRGVAAARNLGIEHSRGDYIALLDADDVWFPEKLEKQVAVLDKSPSTVGLVYAWSVQAHEDGTAPNLTRGTSLEGPVYLPLVHRNFLGNASTPLIRRRCLALVGLFDTHFRTLDAQGCEDWDLYLRIAERYEYRVVPEYLVGYHQSPATMSANWDKMALSYQVLMDGVRGRHPDIPAFVYRWSKSSFLLYLAIKASRAANHKSALVFLFNAARLDPRIFTNRRFRRLLAKNLLGMAGGSGPAAPPHRPEKTTQGTTGIPGIGPASPAPAIGDRWSHLMLRRTNQLLELQKSLKLNLVSSTGDPLTNQPH